MSLLADHRDQVARIQRFAWRDPDLRDSSGQAGRDDVFHLHRLDDADAVGLEDAVADANEHPDDRSLHRRRDLAAWAPLPEGQVLIDGTPRRDRHAALFAPELAGGAGSPPDGTAPATSSTMDRSSSVST